MDCFNHSTVLSIKECHDTSVEMAENFVFGCDIGDIVQVAGFLNVIKFYPSLNAVQSLFVQERNSISIAVRETTLVD